MSYNIGKDDKSDQKYLVDVKPRRRICSTDECLSRAQRNSLCVKHLQSCKDQTMNKSKLINKKMCHQPVRTKKRSTMNKKSRTHLWSTSTGTDLLTGNSDMSVDQIKEIYSNFQHHLEQNLPNENTQLSTEIDDDGKSESSIEYDYTNPLPVLITNNIPYRHVSIATIYLQDDQWHQLELFIKHFSSYASLSNNMNVNSSTTHLVIDDSSTPLQCIFSKKVFQAVARHIFIVSIRWIEECLLRNEIIDESPFEIQGDATMSTMHLTRQSSSSSSSSSPLFSSSISFAIDCTSFQRTLTRNELAELAVLSGATLFDPEQQTLAKIQSQILLVLADPTADRDRLEKKYQQWHKNVKLLTPGFLLKSIIYQKEQSFEDFEL